MNKLIQLISGPRNISTAMMYSFAQRSDTSVIDEPFYAAYLNNHPSINHPGKKEILETQSVDPLKVIEELLHSNCPTEYLFVKNMAHHCVAYDLEYMLEHRSIFLIRHPALILRSFEKVVKNPTADDIGLQREWELYNMMLKNAKFKPVVLDSALFLSDPFGLAPKLCRELNIPYEEQMLKWEARKLDEDGVWAKYWYSNVHKSTGFKQSHTEIPILGESLKEIENQVMPFYEALRQKAIN
jgi:hypothetical protein